MREEEKGESSPKDWTMLGPSASVGGTLPPLFLLHETVYLYLAFLLPEVSSGHHLPTAGGCAGAGRGGEGWRCVNSCFEGMEISGGRCLRPAGNVRLHLRAQDALGPLHHSTAQ